MIAKEKIKRTVSLMVILAAILLPGRIYADFCKNNTEVNYKGVTAKVVDRRQPSASHQSTYGYVEFYNTHDFPVKVTFMVYGHGREAKPKMVHKETIVLKAHEKRGQVYPYDVEIIDGKKREHKLFSVTIDVWKIANGDDKSTAASSAKMTDDEFYKYFVARSENGGKLTQDDYARAINIISAYIDRISGPLRAAKKASRQGDYTKLNELQINYSEDLERIQTLCDILDEADEKGLLSASIRQRAASIQDKIDALDE